MNFIGEQLMKTKQLINEGSVKPLLESWQRLYSRMGETVFRVAVVGEFSRGKSTLINKLIGQDILPVGNLPTTAMLTRIIYGAEPILWWHKIDGCKEQLTLTSDSWEQLSASIDGNDPAGSVNIELPNAWLKASGVELIDTPGAGDSSGSRALITTQAIAQCDATLVAVSAVSALSLTERDFIEQHILARKVPKIAVILTKLDQIKLAERAKMVDFARTKLAEWSNDIIFLEEYAAPLLVAGAAADSGDIGAVTALLNKWTTDARHEQLRHLQVGVQIADLLGLLRDDAQARRQAILLTRDQGRQALAEARAKVDTGRLAWEDIRLELGQRELEFGKWLEKNLLSCKADIVENLSLQLAAADNPKEWWENFFPRLMKKEMGGIARNLEQSIVDRLTADAAWLEMQERTLFAWTVKAHWEMPRVRLNHEVQPRGNDIADLNRIRLFSRIGAGVATIGGYYLFGPVWTALSVAGGVYGEVTIANNLKEQREKLETMVEEVLDRTVAAAIDETRQKLRDVYDKLIRDSEKQEELWYNARIQALQDERPCEQADLQEVDAYLERVDQVFRGQQQWNQETAAMNHSQWLDAVKAGEA